jgi:ankyrin repeat protein
MKISDYSGRNWNGRIIDKFKNELSKWKNDKQRLKNIFRPNHDISLFLNAVKHDADFAAYLIQFAIVNHVDSSILLDSVYEQFMEYYIAPLDEAVRKGNYQLVEMILKFAAGQRTDTRSMNIIFTFGLEKVIDERNCLGVMRATVTLAKDNGVDVAILFRADDEGKTPIHLAACKKYFYWVDSVIKLAKECGICAKSLFGPDRTGNSPLHYAAMVGDDDSVEAILNFATDSGVDVAGLFQPNDERRTPLHCAAMNTSHNNTFDTVLWRATRNEVPLHQLIEADSDGRTPLHLLANNLTTTVKYEEAVQDILRIAHELSQLAAILKRDRHGRTPLDSASIKGNEVIARAILKSTAQLDQGMVHVLLEPDTFGQTPLHLAAQEGKDKAARVIMQAAAEFGKEMVKTLLAQDERGRTSLRLALQYKYRGDSTGEVIMQLALENGVDWRTLIDTKDAALCLKLKEIFYKQIICEPWIWPRLFPSKSR